MNRKDKKIETAVSNEVSVFTDNPITLFTKNNYAYYATNMLQIAGIVECGYLVLDNYTSKGHRKTVINKWLVGNNKLCNFDYKPVIEVSNNKITDDEAISVFDLSGIWIFDGEQDRYVNRLKDVLNAFKENVLVKKEKEYVKVI